MAHLGCLSTFLPPSHTVNTSPSVVHREEQYGYNGDEDSVYNQERHQLGRQLTAIYTALMASLSQLICVGSDVGKLPDLNELKKSLMVYSLQRSMAA